MQKDKDDIGQLRKRLQDCEALILRLAKPFDGYWDKTTEEVIDDHLGTRKWILDKMFEKHATEAEVRRFEVVNERLLAMTKQLNERHLTLQDQMSAIHTLGGEPFELETTLLYSHNSSRWRRMLSMARGGTRCCGSSARIHDWTTSAGAAAIMSATSTTAKRGPKVPSASPSLTTSVSATPSTPSAPTCTTPSPTSYA